MASLTAPLPAHERLVHPVLTPRFVPVCSDELLSSLGDLARERNLMVQSHMCESRDQMEWVRSTRGKEDEAVFDAAGLLTPSTVQAHVTGFTPALVGLVKERGVTVAHCPLSNAYFSDAAFPLRE
jgi:guanine deaminase